MTPEPSDTRDAPADVPAGASAQTTATPASATTSVSHNSPAPDVTDDDDDEPPAKSWVLDDDAAETDEVDKQAAAPAQTAQAPVTTGEIGDVDAPEDRAPAQAAAAETETTVSPDARSAEDEPASSAAKETAPADSQPATAPASETAPPTVPAKAAPATASVPAGPVHTDQDSEGEDPDAEDAEDTATQASATAAQPEQTGPGTRGSDRPGGSSQRQVTVVPGVPRYHEENCILVRFMDDTDIQRMTEREAAQAGCTPCRACQPDAEAN